MKNVRNSLFYPLLFLSMVLIAVAGFMTHYDTRRAIAGTEIQENQQTSLKLTVNTEGPMVRFSWNGVPGYGDYNLLFSLHYNDIADEFHELYMGDETEATLYFDSTDIFDIFPGLGDFETVEKGISFYAAVEAYDGQGKSQESNMEYVMVGHDEQLFSDEFDALGSEESRNTAAEVSETGASRYNLTVSPGSHGLAVGETKSFTPSGGTGIYSATSSNASVASVKMSSNGKYGLVTGNKNGSATIDILDVTRSNIGEYDGISAHSSAGGYTTLKVGVPYLMELFRDTSFKKPLDDWSKSGSRLQSAKYMFGETTPIYVRVLGPEGLGDNVFTVKVKSESDTTGVILKLYEVSSGVYRNKSSSILRLSTKSGSYSGYTAIKVVDEEKLTFVLRVDGVSKSSLNVMVDRGEYASCGIQIFIKDAQKFRDEMDKSRVNWFRNGYMQYSNSCGSTNDADYGQMPLFIRRMGSSSSNESDFMHYTSHGASSGYLYDDSSNRIVRPSEVKNASDWNKDSEWILANACSTLNKSGGGRNAWDDALFGKPRPSHMILGYHDSVSGDLTGVFDDFFDHATGGTWWDSLDTIINSFYHANTDLWADEPCAIVTHADNVGDMLSVVTGDTTSTSMRYYWYDTSGNVWHEDPYTKNTEIAGNKVWIKSDLPADTPSALPALTMELKSLKSKPEGFKEIKRAYGLDVFWKPLGDFGLKSQPEGAAVSLATSSIKQSFGEIPADATNPVVRTFYGLAYERGQSIDTSNGIPLGRSVCFSHFQNGIRVLGDRLSASVFDGRVVKVRTCWHDVVLGGDRSAEAKALISASEALELAVQDLKGDRSSSSDNTGVFLDSTELCYYGFHESGKTAKTFVPTWRFKFEEKGRFKIIDIDAFNGERMAENILESARRKISSGK